MKYVIPLVPQDRDALTLVHQTHTNHRVRQRAHAILLSNRGYKPPDISLLLESHRDRVSLYDHPRSECPLIYNHEDVDYLKLALDKQPQQLGLAKADLEQFTGKNSLKAR